MKTEKISETFVRNLLRLLPDWHSKLVRPFKDRLNREMSLETYYCLQTLRTRGTVTMTELAGELRVPKQQVTKLVDKLYDHRFVERVSSDKDRRMIRILLTPLAEAYLDEYYLKNTVFIKNLEEQLTDSEIAEINDAVEVLGRILPKLK